ncbi:MAG: AAA family ATPase [Proteobacteria bacterium]|nr:AAA family ATPase [Pseudomonadota bacterium]
MSAKVIVVSNEKGGSGKTTLAVHLVVSLLETGAKVATLDLDSRQQSFSRYIQNRADTAKKHNINLLLPEHKVFIPSKENDLEKAKAEDTAALKEIIDAWRDKFDYIVIDTPGHANHISSHICSYADTLITPVNDSFIDVDLLGKATADNLDKVSAGIYSAMLWEQRLQRAARDGGEMQWFVVRNRLAALNTINNRNIAQALGVLAKKLGFKMIDGFSDRVIFKELFLYGLTLHDSIHTDLVRVTASTLAARQEMRAVMQALGIKTGIGGEALSNTENTQDESVPAA